MVVEWFGNRTDDVATLNEKAMSLFENIPPGTRQRNVLSKFRGGITADNTITHLWMQAFGDQIFV